MIIQAPDGKEIEFPESMGVAEVTAAMQRLYPPSQTATMFEGGGAGGRGVTGDFSGKKPWSEVGAQAIENLPSSAVEVGKNLITPLIHPVDTAKALGSVALGGAQKLVPGEQQGEYEPYFDAVVNHIGERYGDMEKFKATLAEDPVGVAMDLATVVSAGGAGLKLAGKAASLPGLARAGEAVSAAGKAMDPATIAIDAAKGIASPLTKVAARGVSEGLGITTGTGYESIKKAFRGGDEFTEALRGRTESADIFTSARDAMHNLKDSRRTIYREQLANLRKSQVEIDMSPIRRKLTQLMDDYGIKRSAEEGLDFSRSGLDRSEIPRIKELIESVDDWGSRSGDATAIGLDTLKQKLNDFYSPSKNSSALVASLSDTVRGTIVRTVPEYAKMTKDYQKATGIIKDVERALSLGTRDATDTAIRKLTSAMRENNDFRRAMVAELEAFSGKDLQAQIAGVALSPYMPRGAFGRILTGVEAVGAAMSPGSLGSYMAILATGSPRVVGEFVRALGIGTRAAKKVGLAAEMIPISKPAIFQAGRIANQAEEQFE